MDRLIQQCIYQVLEPIAEAKFHERSNGFRPNRSAEHAMAQTYKMIQTQNLHYVIDIDIKSFFDNVQHGKLLKQMWQLGIRDKKLLKIISVMLKAEIAGIGFPEKGTPQGGIISPLLSNIVLNEFDWWVASQWETIPTRHEYQGKMQNGSRDRSPTYNALRNTNLKECFIVRYADDFKIFCRHRNDAERLFKAIQNWLKERLELEINAEKSKIINLRKYYSEFLGFKIKVHRKGKNYNLSSKYTVKSHLSDKSIARIKQYVSKTVELIQKPKDDKEQLKNVGIYNSNVVGFHNYYSVATHVTIDFHKIAFQVRKKLNARLKDKLEKIGVINFKYIQEKYGNSKQLRFIRGQPLLPIGYIQHKNPMNKKKSINKFTAQGREEIHKGLQKVNVKILYFLMRNSVKDQSIEYNDNRLSLYCAMQGKCAITNNLLEEDEIHCHHIIPRKDGGNDSYKNLLLINKNVHILLHASKAETIEKYIAIINPNKVQLNRINKYRIILKLAEI